MTPELLYAPLLESDIEELAELLHCEAVYEFIGGMPTRAEFDLWLRRSMAGPPDDSTGERWINVVVRLAATGQIIGRLEANVHDGLAEVAFLYGHTHWGSGVASEGLHWLHEHLRQHSELRTLWATTHPDNHRSARLLAKCGYEAIPTEALPKLYSYDDGDLVFTRAVPTHQPPWRGVGPRAI